MVHIAIVDDHSETRTELAGYIQRYASDRDTEITIDLFSDGIDLLEYEPGSFEIFIIDIEMPHIDGLETARQIRMADERAVIIFITGFIQYAIQGYSVNAMNFLVKPVDYPTLSRELEKAFARADRLRPSYLCLRTDEGMIQLPVDDIRFIETVGRKVSFHTLSGNYACWETISTLERSLSVKGFFRCHKAYLINLAHLERVLEHAAVVGGEEVMVSRYKRKELMHALVRFASERA